MAASRHSNSAIVSFVCQKCCQPLRFDQTGLSTKEMLAAAKQLQISYDHEEFPSTSEDGVKDSFPFSRIEDIPPLAPPIGEDENSILDEKIVKTHKQLTVAGEFFDLLSSHCVVDHPLCKECPEAVLDCFDRQIIFSQDAEKGYQKLLHSLKCELESSQGEETKLDGELENLRRAEQELKDKLFGVEKQRKVVQVELKKEEERKKRLEMEEEEYYKEFNQYHRQLLEFRDEQTSIDYKLQYSSEQLQRLCRTNVINSTFYIWHNGLFGTINGFRLGRLTTVPVEWTEINAAWGQATLLLYSLARKVDYTFQHYQLVPYGNQSYIQTLDGKDVELPLHGSGGFKFYWDSKFDRAMVAYLDCLWQLKNLIERNSKNFTLPYKINREMIGEDKEMFSVKMRFNSLEQWTKAMKFMLTDLKWALTWVATMDVPDTESGH